MGLFSRKPNYIEHISLDIYMEFNYLTAKGVGGISWKIPTRHSKYDEAQLLIFTVCLLYGRSLFIQEESREGLFSRVKEFATNIIDNKPVLGENWVLEAGGQRFNIWPWQLVDPIAMKSPIIYTVKLISLQIRGFGLLLNMAQGLERILVPTSFLITLFSIYGILNEQKKIILAKSLIAMNRYYGSPDKTGILMSDIKAFNYAISDFEGSV